MVTVSAVVPVLNSGRLGYDDSATTFTVGYFLRSRRYYCVACVLVTLVSGWSSWPCS
jgi:hypothetical protein